MADEAKAPAKPKRAKAAPKPAAAKAPAAPKAAKAAAAPASESKVASGTAVIKFDKVHHGGRVRGAVNGQKFDFPVGSDVTVTAAQLEALSNSGAKYEIVTPLAGEDGAEGSAPSSTIGGTATRLEEPNPGAAIGEDGKPVEPPELRQITDEELKNSQEANKSQPGVEQPEA